MKRKQRKPGRKPRQPGETTGVFGRHKSTEPYVQHADKINRFKRAYRLPETLNTFRELAEELTKRSGVMVTPGTLHRYIVDGKEPRRNDIRRALGLPTTRTVRANPVSRWADMSVGELRRAMENRRDYP